MRRLVIVVAVVASAAACPGLLTTPGNDFPCDFSQPPGVRDAVCSPGDVCGVQNRCQRFQYEGPQFEGKPTFPFFTDAGAVLHPLVLKGPIDFVARVQGSPLDAVVVHGADGTFRVDRTGVAPASFSRAPHELGDAVLLARPVPTLPPLVVGREPGNEVFYENAGARNRVRDGLSELSAVRLRAFDAEGGLQLAAITTPPARGGVIRMGPAPDFVEVTTDQPLDVGPGPSLPGRPRTVVILSGDGFRVRAPDGGISLVAAAAVPSGSTLAVDTAGSTYAVLTGAMPPVLSTWTATRTSTSFELEPAWSDCTPCADRPLAFRPGRDLEGPFVDVLCSGVGLRRVRGATASSVSACVESDTRLPFDFGMLATARGAAVQDSSDPTRFLAAGKAGQVWRGATPGDAVPLFLDRLPLDVLQVDTPGKEGLVALTPVGAFARAADPALAVRFNGFRVLAPDKTRQVAAFST